ncbi:hypothetical protein CPC08DRAFT_817805 [Agrocybe pediades]|nr:hypothetical protein CPC08DRAFT_817805 [Agrocybe pediades]
MLYIQVSQVLIRRPARDTAFWLIVFYSGALFPLTTIAFIGKVKFVQTMYISNLSGQDSAKQYIASHMGEWANVMSQICTTLVPWIGDLLILYRLTVVWNRRIIAIVPGAIYLGRVAMSVPLLISSIRNVPEPHAETYGLVFYILCVCLNVMATSLISLRLFMMRHKAVRVLGNLQASLYNSTMTMFVESGAFFTVWGMTYLILRATDSWAQDIFLQSYPYVIALTRMLIILRMAQDRAWSRDLITAADTGVLDWEVSSMNSMSLNHSKPGGINQVLPAKFREDSLSSHSTRLNSSCT